MSLGNKTEVLRLAEMVGYETDSIVSRSIAKSDFGNVTLFALDAGQELSPHTTTSDALAHVLEGEAEITVNDRATLVRPGEAIILPAGVPHAVKAPMQCKMLLTMMRV